jgi:hypothetical protein
MHIHDAQSYQERGIGEQRQLLSNTNKSNIVVKNNNKRQGRQGQRHEDQCNTNNIDATIARETGTTIYTTTNYSKDLWWSSQ